MSAGAVGCISAIEEFGRTGGRWYEDGRKASFETGMDFRAIKNSGGGKQVLV